MIAVDDMVAAARTATEQDWRWASVVARDRAADGKFFYSVQTTGVYCRPSCAARLARPENVRFHPTRAEAERAGFRPCRRCKPDQPPPAERHAAKVAEACRLIEAADELPSLGELARAVGLSPHHFHRVFKAVAGVTPKAYATARRAERVRAGLTRSGTVTDYRAGGTNAEIRFAVGECSLGSILVAKSQRGICAILLGDDPDALVRDLQDRFPRATLIGGEAEFEHLVAEVVGFVEAPRHGLDLPLDVRGTAFQRRVWRALQEIPSGETASYTDLAKRIGSPKAVRAVALACASNRLAVAIPCHRVVRHDGALSGYRWGVERKRALLDRETVA